ncbi:hypothetical protein PISMIDRAFT_19306 [Pisolithus microcarpus 441]|uniref:Uncharacterized protein n=1 Tax=Pisolithus microcarpus 441 TaxID=765257 RepID=A0A0C9YCX9_9AGAM|nr:hypothetical protein BKA83DRAFT_19306 [Pisolithus microcarpus]KIK11704.1 hypothetical protein PISMIDRAFT_19306 [Pisolithus microcarpus 441]
MTWALFELARHPDIQTKLHEELLSFGEPSYDQLTTGFPYLDAVVQETLRFWPAAQERVCQVSVMVESSVADSLLRVFMYGVLYAISSEIFPAIHRGTGNCLTSTSKGIFAVMAPVIALYANLETVVPVYVAGSLLLFAGFVVLLLPYEPRDKVSI